MWLRCEWGPSWRAFISSTMRWRNGLIVRLVIETASLVEVDTSIFRKAFAGPLRRSPRRPIMLDPGRAPHQSIAERFSALAKFCLSEPGLSTTGTRLRPDIRACFDCCTPQSGPAMGKPPEAGRDPGCLKTRLMVV